MGSPKRCTPRSIFIGLAAWQKTEVQARLNRIPEDHVYLVQRLTGGTLGAGMTSKGAGEVLHDLQGFLVMQGAGEVLPPRGSQ